MIEQLRKGLDTEIWAVENDAQNLYATIGRLDYVLDQLVNTKEIQSKSYDLAKIVRMRNVCQSALLHLDELTDEVSKIKEWNEGVSVQS